MPRHAAATDGLTETGLTDTLGKGAGKGIPMALAKTQAKWGRNQEADEAAAGAAKVDFRMAGKSGRKGKGERTCQEETERDRREKDRERAGDLGNAKEKTHGVRRFRPAGDRAWDWDLGGERSADSVEGKKRNAARKSRPGPSKASSTRSGSGSMSWRAGRNPDEDPGDVHRRNAGIPGRLVETRYADVEEPWA